MQGDKSGARLSDVGAVADGVLNLPRLQKDEVINSNDGHAAQRVHDGFAVWFLRRGFFICFRSVNVSRVASPFSPRLTRCTQYSVYVIWT